MTLEETDMLNVAAQFVNSTASHIFLTGKAGTGKTTFLRNLALKTHKNFVILAPTGIAALNAQGVTIHSQFLFPFGSFIPEKSPSGNFGTSSNFITQHTLARKHPLNSVRKQVLRAADLIIIDEVSMLRADMLDAIDYRMRSVKGNFSRSFGGAQVLMIGDLYQLPPIVKNQEWSVLRNYYKSMHFFEALALKQDGLVYIELDKIFRQQDQKFIGLLNNLRNNIATRQDIETLNTYYKDEAEIDPDEEIITITTHNSIADGINQKKLEALPGPSSYYEAETKGDFPEKLYPILEEVELKVGAQIMFVKNDSTGAGDYFNGKLARVEYIDDEGVTVVFTDTNAKYILKEEKWENKKYTINDSSKELEEEVVGTFMQYPVKLAWAVTVHKSQGLTFEKAIIDVGQAFAPGQVYVALSRLKSLEGLTLRTRINTNSLSSDGNVVSFTQGKEQQRPLPVMLQEQQSNFLQRLLATTFDFSAIEQQLAYMQNKGGGLEFEDETMRKAIGVIQGRLENEKINTARFKNQLLNLLRENNLDTLLERIKKGSAYYSAFMEENLRLLLRHLADVERFARVKTYVGQLQEVDQLLMKTLGEIEKAAYMTTCIVKGEEIHRIEKEEEKRVQRRVGIFDAARKEAEAHPKSGSRKTGRKRKAKATTGKKQEKGETYKITFALAKEGLSVGEIAKSRGLTEGTIETHLVRGIREGELDISKFLDKDVIELLTEKIKSRDKNKTVVDTHNALKGKYSYGILRMVQASIDVAKG